MKLIESKAELLPWEPGIEGVYKAIERAGRTCYKSENKMTDDSAKGFVDRMIASKHTAMLEQGTVYLTFKDDAEEEVSFYFGEYVNNKYSIANYDKFGYVNVTTNLRVLVENNWLDDLKYLSDPTEYHEMRYSFKFTCSRAIANELVRHRVFSFAQESQRYCNYSKDKFGGEITFIAPSWYNGSLIEESKGVKIWDDFRRWNDGNWIHVYCKDVSSKWFFKNCLESEHRYLHMINDDNTKLSPQQAREVLPNSTKTEIVMTGFASDLRYLFDLRLFGKTGAPHPDMVDLMEKAKAEAEKNGIWEDIMSHPSRFE